MAFKEMRVAVHRARTAPPETSISKLEVDWPYVLLDRTPEAFFPVSLASARPTSTVHRRSRSAFGWGATDSMRPTTTPSNGGAAGSTLSTSSPDIVSLSASAAVSSGGSTSVRSQRSENFMWVRYANCSRKRRSFS